MASIAAEPEVEITPEMEAAGMDALRGYDPDWDSPGDYAIRVFRAMMEAAERTQLPQLGEGHCDAKAVEACAPRRIPLW
jgi:hypothetical protein